MAGVLEVVCAGASASSSATAKPMKSLGNGRHMTTMGNKFCWGTSLSKFSVWPQALKSCFFVNFSKYSIVPPESLASSTRIMGEFSKVSPRSFDARFQRKRICPVTERDNFHSKLFSWALETLENHGCLPMPAFRRLLSGDSRRQREPLQALRLGLEGNHGLQQSIEAAGLTRSGPIANPSGNWREQAGSALK